MRATMSSAVTDRMGFRLTGPPVESVSGCDILTDGIVNGAVQITGTGEPIVLMADRQTTGGYAKIASIINVDIPLFAQLRPGQMVRFERCGIEEAQRLIREAARLWEEHCRMLDESDPSAARKAEPAGFVLKRDGAQGGTAADPVRTGGWKNRGIGGSRRESHSSLWRKNGR